MKKKLFAVILPAAFILAGLLYWGFEKTMSATRIGFINYGNDVLSGMAESVAENSFIQINKVPWDDNSSPDLSIYNILVVNGMGLRLTPEQKTLITSAAAKGIPVYVGSATSVEVELSTLPIARIRKLQQYYRGGSKENFKRMLNYLRREIDGKIFFVDPVKPPVEPPGDCFYHVDTDKIFKDYASYLTYYKEAKLYKPGAARVCYATGTKVGAANRGHVDDIIRSLEKAGFNVFPIGGWDKYEEFVRAVKPDLLVARTGMGTHLELYKELNIPVFCPLNVSRPYDEWLKDQRGFAGGHLTWHIVWPEMDGRIVPYALTAQFPDKYGFHTYKVLPERLENWTRLVKKYINLRKKPNSEKKLVIIYYKGPGENALSAGGLEVGESLFNVLKNLKKAGYRVDNLPENADKLLETIQKYGKVLGAYAKGAISDFLKNGKPELVAAEDYASWAKAAMPADLYEELIKRYGEPPGEYFSVKKNGKKYLAISRVRFGNVVIMPLPMAGTGSDTSKIVHGAKTAPPHAYIGVYLWARFGFKADALVHFGTHGSVEFTPWKQNALSSYDWPDILMGSIPHSYIYIINNIGEAVLAKRRSYATMVSHLTAPFMKADIYGDLQILHKKIEEYETVEEPQLKAAYNRTICKLIRKLNLEKDLSLPEVKCPLPDEHMEKVHNYLHELSAAKVNRGLYVLDRPYTGEEASETALMMTNDPVARAFADLDHIKGKISGKQLDDLHFFQVKYLKKANTIINTILEKNAAPESFIDPADLRRLKKSKESRTPSNAMNMMNMAKMARRMRQAGTKSGTGMGSGTGMRRRMTMQAPAGERKAGPEQIEELLLAMAEYPERIVFISSLSDPKKLENALAMTKLRNRMKERMLARNQPERRGFLAIVSDKNVLALLGIMKDPAHRKSVFDKLADPGFREKMRTIEKKAMQRRAAEMKMKIAGLQKRRALLEKTGIRDPEAMRKRLDKLKELAADCELALGKRNLIADAGKIEDLLRKTKTATTKLEKKYKAYLNSVKVLYEALSSVKKYKADLLYSRKSEILSFLNSLKAGYTEPSSGGDPIVNPRSIPTGRNLYPIDAQMTPTREAWDTGKQMAQSLIDITLKKEGRYPKKVAFTLWGGEFIRTYGTALAQIFYLLGVEPVWNSRGAVGDVRLIPMEKLKRPRIDVVMQTSGQFRDTAPSRIYLLDKAVRLAGEADDDGKYGNYVKEGNREAEKIMLKHGVSPVKARKMATARIFGGANGAYGTHIMGLVESGDKWENEKEIADRYLNNMGAVYTEDNWCEYVPGLFEGALQNTDTVVHPRSSNTHGPLSLDHYYEFMGGINLTIRNVTGRDPDAYFLDLRQPGKAVMQNAREAAMIEARSTVLNPKFIKEMMEEGPTGAGTFAETTRNMYGWEVMKPEMLEDYVWEEMKNVYVDDSLKLGVKEYFEKKNPYALQEITAVMLETIRKGYWKADKKTQKQIAELHAELVKKYRPGCSGFVCDNAKLRNMISSLLGDNTKKKYNSALDKTLNPPAEKKEEVEGTKMEKQEIKPVSAKDLVKSNLFAIIVAVAVILLLGIAILIGARKKNV